jgi:hypothetical protein
MRTQISLLLLVSAAVTSFGCSGSRLSDADLTRLCQLQVRCSGGFLTQDACETATRESRDDAAAAGCAAYFGAAGRCAIRTDSCGVDSSCADHVEHLQSCLTPRGDAGSGHDAGRVELLDSGTVTPSMLRIGEGGAVEVFHDGRWGPICDDGFGQEEADVVCRHLGFTGATSFSTITGASADFWLDDVSCTGAEVVIDQCSHSDWGSHNCSASETQAVVCF